MNHNPALPITEEPDHCLSAEMTTGDAVRMRNILSRAINDKTNLGKISKSP